MRLGYSKNLMMDAPPEPEQPTTTETAVSVVIPTYNRSRLLKEAIESLWNQTLDPRRFEIIVVDNASVDGTPDMMRELQARSPCRLVYHRLPADHGPAWARNEGVRLAKGELIAFTDSDCRADREWLVKGLGAFRQDVAFVTGSVVYKPEQRARFFSGVSAPLTKEHPSYPTCNAFYRRKVFLDMGGFDATLCYNTFLSRPMECADTDLAWRIKESGCKNVFLPDLVIYHEIGVKSPWNWILDPFRLFVVPALVRRHPQLRIGLLHGRIFFFKENALFYLGVLGALLAILLHWSFLILALAYPALVAFVLKENLTLRKFPALVLQILLLAVRQAFICAGLIYGSIRFRSVVL